MTRRIGLFIKVCEHTQLYTWTIWIIRKMEPSDLRIFNSDSSIIHYFYTRNNQIKIKIDVILLKNQYNLACKNIQDYKINLLS